MNGTRDRSFMIEIGIGPLDGRTDDVRAAISDQLEACAVWIDEDPSGQLVLTFTVEAADLWLSVLTTMTAVTQTGYPPRTLRAVPAEGSPAPPPARHRSPEHDFPDLDARTTAATGDLGPARHPREPHYAGRSTPAVW